MKSHSWPILALAFAALVAVIALFGFSAIRQARALHDETIVAHEAYLETEAYLRDIPEDMYLSGVLLRDYLLDPSVSAAGEQRQQLLAVRASLEARLSSLSEMETSGQGQSLQQLRTEVQAYWQSLGQVFEWTPKQKAALGPAFLRQNVLPRRKAVVALAQEISALNTTNLQREQERLSAGQEAFQNSVRRMLIFCLSAGLLVAVVSTYRFATLENREDEQRGQLAKAENEMRRLSRSLVNAQEAERKSLARELHDAVGQMLTGLRMELANLDSQRNSPDKFHEHLEDAKRLNAETLQMVRTMSMGLRPSMLDDLGLAPALEWQGRELSRRSGIPVVIQIDGVLDHMPEAHRTCIYRVVQEALTNCARHARAKNIRVSVYGRRDLIKLTILDDGIGFDPGSSKHHGLGLVGIEERVRELGGWITLISHPGKGTVLTAEIPVPTEAVA
jgi:signal transduction histidine kinase